MSVVIEQPSSETISDLIKLNELAISDAEESIKGKKVRRQDSKQSDGKYPSTQRRHEEKI